MGAGALEDGMESVMADLLAGGPSVSGFRRRSDAPKQGQSSALPIRADQRGGDDPGEPG